ncbi:MAG: hypothetical protein JWO36_5513 [Myxococcales bacterium]|nr:hypothetical protein [Myxococcales bacterium]
MTFQPAILAPVPPIARYLVLGMHADCDPRAALARLRDFAVEASTAIGIGDPLVRAAGGSISRLRAFPGISGQGSVYPSTQGMLWAFLGGTDPGEALIRARALLALIGDGFFVQEEVLAFKYAEGRDLSGYEDGTENPKDERATAVAIVGGAGPGLDGSSFVAVQRWVHDLARLDRLPQDARDNLVGRDRVSNEELADAPASAHVKRAAQESFEPSGFMVRRSMPWGSTTEHGLYFVAYGATLDPFERVLRRMAGLDDGIVDGLSHFTRAVSGGYYWCPPVANGVLDLRALGIG